MRRHVVVLLLAGTFAAATPGYAHHSFAATYLEDQSVTIEGELVQVEFRNPHSFVRVNVKEKDGTMTVYSVEWGGTGQLAGQGVTRDTFKVGDHLIITGSPGRTAADHRVRMVRLRRPADGFEWGAKATETVN